MEAILSTAYFAPVQWYQKLYRYDKCLIETNESYQKQTYRNRCVIATANGRQTLTVPVEHTGKHGGISIKEMRISDHGNWRDVHWNALMSAYGESAFFDYYADDVKPFFQKRWTWLLDFNEAIIYKMCELLDIHPDISHTSHFVCPNGNLEADDYRYAISPKNHEQDSGFIPSQYYQVYAMRNGFQPNLSILDLLFNMGNESIFYL